MEKIKNIECLRTFLIISIVIHHMFINRSWCLCKLFPDISLYREIQTAISHAYNGVEGFFILAGFLMLLTFKPKITTQDFIIKKYIRLSPVIIFSMLICFIGWLLKVIHFQFIPNLITVFLLNSFGICIAIGSNPILWYTSALFGGLLIYFCIYKYFPKNFVKISIPLVIISFTILEILKQGNFNNPLKNYYMIFNIGFLRALGSIGLGALIGKLYKDNIEKIQNFIPNLFQKILIMSSEFAIFSFVIWWMICPHKNINNIFIVLAFCILLVLFVLQKGLLTKILNKDIWVFLGKYQYSIYVVHYIIIKIFGLALWKNNSQYIHTHPYIPIITMILTIISVSILLYHYVEKPCTKYLKNKFLS